jgi:Zn-dependent protease
MNAAEIALFVIPIIVAITFHEAAHGFVALWCGDDTAKQAGRLTLNPIRHIDPFGTVILPLLLIFTAGFAFGYAKPVPVNFAALRHPRLDMVRVAAAGPAMNVVLAFVSVLLISTLGALEGDTAALIGNLLLRSVELNMLLAIFNMLPIPPLDGGKVLAALLPGRAMQSYLHLERYGMLLLLLLLFVLPILSSRSGLNFDIFGYLVEQPAQFSRAASCAWPDTRSSKIDSSWAVPI